jgi:hypothetical protein
MSIASQADWRGVRRVSRVVRLTLVITIEPIISAQLSPLR